MPATSCWSLGHRRPLRSAAWPAALSIDIARPKTTVGLSRYDEGTDGAIVGEDNVRFLILLVMGIVVVVAVFCYFLFMSEIHIG